MTNVQSLDVQNTTLPLTTEISVEDKKAISEKLGKTLAGSYVLYHKTHSFHWNVTGPMFISIHELTEGQYQDLASAIDDIAERIRSLGQPAPQGLSTYLEMSSISDSDGIPTAGDMLHQLAADHLTLADEFRNISEAADEVRDVFTADMAVARVGTHEKAAWMLTALGSA